MNNAVVLNYTQENATSILCQAMLDETLRLRTCKNQAERESIRGFLTESATILGGSTEDMQNMYEITEYEKQYINQGDALVTVSFLLPRHDWNLLRISDTWHQFEKMLQETRNKHIQKCNQEKEAKKSETT